MVTRNRHLLHYDMDYWSINDLDNGTMGPVIDTLMEFVDNDTVFVDMGAYIGAVALPIMDVKKPKYSILIEANKGAFKILKKNVTNVIKNNNYKLINQPIAEATHEVDYCTADNTGSLTRVYDHEIWPMSKRDAVCLDDLLATYNKDHRPVVVKMDIELSEPRAWKGMKKSLPDIKAVVIEFFFHAWRQQRMDPMEFYKEITDDGFKFYSLGQHRPFPYKEFEEISHEGNYDFLLLR